MTRDSGNGTEPGANESSEIRSHSRLTETAGNPPVTEQRPRAGAWTYTYGISVVIGGYGVSIGFLVKPDLRDWQTRTWVPVKFFRNWAYRGLFS